jgi:hypothetical protein
MRREVLRRREESPSSKGGASSVYAQFDFEIAGPCVQRPKILC